MVSVGMGRKVKMFSRQELQEGLADRVQVVSETVVYSSLGLADVKVAIFEYQMLSTRLEEVHMNLYLTRKL